MAAELNATVTMRYEINHGLMVLQVTPDEEMPPFKAGQYTVLGLPGSASRTHLAEPEGPPADPDKLIKRAYSVASSSLQGRYFEFYVALVRTGALTPRLFAVGQGERIHIKMNYSVRVVAGLGDDGRINRLFYPETGVIH